MTFPLCCFQWEKKKSSFGHLLFSLFFCSMPQNIPLPFHIHTKTVSSYETFWNSEHIRVYESHSVATVKERNAMVSARWQLDQSVKKALVGRRPLNESMLLLQEELAQEIRAASVLRKKHTVKLVDRKGSACDPSKATHLQIENTTTQIDSHWATRCTDLQLHTAPHTTTHCSK